MPIQAILNSPAWVAIRHASLNSVIVTAASAVVPRGTLIARMC